MAFQPVCRDLHVDTFKLEVANAKTLEITELNKTITKFYKENLLPI